MLAHFHKRWRDLPLVVIDTETTGVVPGVDAVVQIGLAKFPVDRELVPYVLTSFIKTGRPIPPEATAIHGVTQEMTEWAPTIQEFFARDEVRELVREAQPLAFNAPFDRAFMPAGAFDRDWPWFDTLTLVRLVDRYAKGKDRHRLEVACERHGVKLEKAHDAGADAKAAGELFFKIADANDRLIPAHLGDALKWFELQRAEEWHRFNDWRARQPPQEAP